MSKSNNARTKRARSREELSIEFAKNTPLAGNMIEINRDVHNILSDIIDQKDLFKGFHFKYIKECFESTATEKKSAVAQRIRYNKIVTKEEYDNLQPLLKRIEKAIETRNALNKSGDLKNEFRLEKNLTEKEKRLEKKKSEAHDPKTTFEYEQTKESYKELKREILRNKLKYIQPLISNLIADYADQKAQKQISCAQRREAENFRPKPSGFAQAQL